MAGQRNATFAYSNDLLVGVTDMGGQSFQYTYDWRPDQSLARPNATNGYDVTTIGYTGSPAGGAFKTTITYPEGNKKVYSFGGYPWSDIEVDNGLGVTRYTPNRNYTWLVPPFVVIEEITDPLGRCTTFFYCDTTNANAVIDGKLRKRVEPDGTSVEYTYTRFWRRGDHRAQGREPAGDQHHDEHLHLFHQFAGERDMGAAVGSDGSA